MTPGWKISSGGALVAGRDAGAPGVTVPGVTAVSGAGTVAAGAAGVIAGGLVGVSAAPGGPLGTAMVLLRTVGIARGVTRDGRVGSAVMTLVAVFWGVWVVGLVFPASSRGGGLRQACSLF